METIQIILKSANKIEGSNNNGTFKIPYRHYFDDTNQLYNLKIDIITQPLNNGNDDNNIGNVYISGFSNKTYKNFLHCGFLRKVVPQVAANPLSYELLQQTELKVYPPMADYITVKVENFDGVLFTQTNGGGDMHPWIMILNFTPV
jgi:hypothetical protein